MEGPLQSGLQQLARPSPCAWPCMASNIADGNHYFSARSFFGVCRCSWLYIGLVLNE